MGFFSSIFGKPATKPYTGVVLTQAEMRSRLGLAGPVATFGKAEYAEVNSAAVIELARATRDALFSAGVTKWSTTATCTLFASRFASLAQEKFFNAAFHDFVSSRVIGIAAGELWFHPDTSPQFGPDHAIGVCVTERGVLRIDPQAPDVIRVLSPNEEYLQRSVRFL